LFTGCPTPKQEDHSSLAVREFLFNILAAYLPYLEATSPIHYLRMHHVMVTREPLNMALWVS
jgi:hypothetical protein